MPSIKISKATVDDAQPGDADRTYWDKAIAGFGLKVTPAGRKVYLYRYRIASPGQAAKTQPVTLTIGKHGDLTPDQARDRAKELAGKVAVGVDPRAEDRRERIEAEAAARRETDLALDRKADQWLDHYEHEKERRPSSVSQAKLVVRRHLKPALRSKPLPEIGKPDIQSIIEAIPVRQKAMRRAVFAYASILFGWAASSGYIDRNPLQDMNKPPAPKARERVLTDEELAAVWRGAAELPKPFGPFYRLLILTGQRRDEVATLNWADLDRAAATWTIPADRAKNGRAHIVPLTPQVIAELDVLAGSSLQWPRSGLVLTTTGRTPISGFSKAKTALDDLIGEATAAAGGKSMADWRVHDLRRTLATGLQRLGVRFEVTEAVLNHISGSKGGVAGIYQRHDWKDEKRAALTAWANHVERLLSGAPKSNVIQLAEARA
jgi:integrase